LNAACPCAPESAGDLFGTGLAQIVQGDADGGDLLGHPFRRTAVCFHSARGQGTGQFSAIMERFVTTARENCRYPNDGKANRPVWPVYAPREAEQHQLSTMQEKPTQALSGAASRKALHVGPSRKCRCNSDAIGGSSGVSASSVMRKSQ